MLDDNNRKILGHFVWTCNLLVARFVTEDNLQEVEAQEKLKDMSINIEKTYGLKFITSSYPNSNRQIESELMRIVLKNLFVDYHLTRQWTSGLLKKSHQFLSPKKTAGSLVIIISAAQIQNPNTKISNAKIPNPKFQIIISIFCRNPKSQILIYGIELIPGHMLTPSLYVLPKSQIIWDLGRQNVQITSIWDLEFGISAKNTNYNLGFGIWDFGIWDFGIWILNLGGRKKKDVNVCMEVTMNQYARLIIGNEIFGSMIAGRHKNNAIILAKWKTYRDRSSNIYSGEIYGIELIPGHMLTPSLYVLPKSQIIWDLGRQNVQITSIWDLEFGISAKNTNYNLGFGIWDFGIWDFGIWILNLGGRKKKDVNVCMEVTMNQYARLIIGNEIFGSMIAGRHKNNAIILAKWKTYRDRSSNIYSGESNTKLWKAEYCKEGQNSIIAVHRIYGRA
ncbi:hypothetical protein Glove_396g36 [Diversispora epigaea]|uniref:Uncharacterized protein n=1 Tax=Diversispora epigaea TaxID=1348612 RepID=A0A397H5X0_9GLOM|nr:hypothetical protein Glove_396g36 [Diversispora epigaea]